MRRHPAFSLVLFLALCPVLLATGCATRTQPQPELPMTGQAQLTYDFLLYQQELRTLQTMVQTQVMDDAQMTEALEQQQRTVAVLDRVLEKAPSARLYGEKASLYFNSRQIPEAKAILKKALNLYPGNRELSALLVNAYLIEGNINNAMITLEEYLIENPEDHDFRKRLAAVLLDAKQYGESLDQIKAIPTAERDLRIRYVKARAESRLGKRNQAVKTLKSILAEAPDHYEALAELAYIYELEKKLSLAAGAYEKLMALGGPEEDIRLRLITLNLKLNRVSKALDTALAGPNRKAYLLSAASAFLKEEFPAQSSAVLDVLSTHEPIPSEYFFYKAVIAFEAEEDSQKALTFLDQVPENDQFFNQALQFRIQILHNLGRTDEALSLLAEAQATYPKEPTYYQMEAEYWGGEEKYAKSLSVVERGLEHLPDDMGLLYRRGLLLEELGRRDEALASVERILQTDPDNAEALNFVGYTLAEDGRDLKRALILVQNALLQEPNNGYMIDSLAWVQYKMGNLAKAWEHIRRAVEVVPSDPTIWEHYGDIAAALGKKLLAIKGYRNALKFGTTDEDAVKEKIKGL